VTRLRPISKGFHLESDLSVLLTGTEDGKEGPRAFAEKRAPVWKGKKATDIRQ
jgi:1,4-dihydroxy-2-naphthoyl-CoA synthase